MKSRDKYVRKMQDKLEEWNTEIKMLAARGSEVKADIKDEYNEQIDSLHAKQDAARLKIEELMQAGDTAWEDLKSGIDLAWAAMGEAIDSARARFR